MKEVNPILKIFSLIAYLVLVIISNNPVALAISGFLILVIMMISGRDLFEYIRSAEAFIILDPKALADAQIIDLLPAIGQLYNIHFAYIV